jgi:chemotaxis protein CheZ
MPLLSLMPLCRDAVAAVCRQIRFKKPVPSPIAGTGAGLRRFNRSPAMSNVDTLRHDLVGIVGELHAALLEIGDAELPQTGIVNNARDRLRYIATLTEQSASHTLRAAESINESLHAQQNAARLLRRKVRSPAALSFLVELDAQHAQALEQVSAIIQAQAFQDLVGQVIAKLMLTVERMESSLAHLLLEEEGGTGKLAGPQVRLEESISQADVDALFG